MEYAAWALAEANSNATLGVGVVFYIDANNFYLYQLGSISGLSGLTAGQYYFVSDATPGLLTATEPTAVTSFSNPLLLALSATTGVVFPYRPSSNYTTSVPSNIDLLLVADPSTPSSNFATTTVGNQVTLESWTRAGGNLLKSSAYTYNGNSQVLTAVVKTFDTDGVTILGQTTTTYTYSVGGVVTSATMTRDV